MPPCVSLLLLALLGSASADYPAYGNGLIQKDTVKAAVLTPTTVAPEISVDDAIEQAKEDIANGGEEPKPTPHHTLRAYIDEILLPRATETKVMLQKDVTDAWNKVEHCALLMEAAKPSRENAEANLARQERKLAMCLRVKNGETIKEEEFCEEWHAAAKNFNPKTLEYAKGNLKTYENILKVYYDFYPKFMKEEAKCREMIAIMHSQDKHCSFRVGEINKLYCGMKENNTKVCHDYDGCYAGTKADYEWTVSKAKQLEIHTKKVYKALECFKRASDGFSFARSIDDERDAGTMKGIKCNPSSAELTEKANTLSIVYPDKVPVKQTCDKSIPITVKHPSWCSWEPATTATTTLSVASQGPSGGPATDKEAALIQDSGNVDATHFSKVEEFLADAEATLKKMNM